jgi:hypothetical protein
MDSHIRRKAVARERVTLDGVAYEIALLAQDEGCLARWHCTLCNQGDQPRLRLTGEAAALEWAHDSLAVHHRTVHGDGARAT